MVIIAIRNVAEATVFNFDFRFESDSVTFNDAARAASVNNISSSRFLMRSGYIDVRGDLNEEVSYRLKWRLDRDNFTTVNATDGFTNHIDQAHLRHRFAENMFLTVGKFSSDIGSIEGNTSPSDVYLRSQALQLVVNNGFMYVTGGRFSYVTPEHDFSLALLNQSETSATDQTKNSFALIYKGYFLEKSLMPILGYYNDQKQSLAGVDLKKDTLMTSAGVKWDPKPYYLILDYLVYDQKNVEAVDQKSSTNSLMAEFGYDLNGLLPKIKYEISQKKTDTEISSITKKFGGVSLILECKPYPKDLFRYHVAVTQLTTKPDGGDTQFEQHFIIGTRITADFLK